MFTELNIAGLQAKEENDGTFTVDNHQIEIIVDERLALESHTLTRKAANNRITIAAVNESLLDVAVYSFLRGLGFRYLGPTDKWTIYPQEDRLDWLAADKATSSQFYYSSMFSSRDVTKLPYYQDWLRKNGLHYRSYLQLGHYGSQINRRYRKQIEANPDWLPVINGERQGWSKNVKLDYTHPGVIELYKEDAERRLKALVARKDASPPYYLSVEPPDGKSFTQAPYSGVATVSDQVFGLANEVANHLAEIDTNANVSLLAYTDHSEPPSFPLAKNMAVMVVTGWFQTAASTAGTMALWAQTNAEVKGVRTYSGVPKNNQLRVQLPITTVTEDLIRQVATYGFRGYRDQTIFAYGSMGYRHYLTTALLRDPDVNLDVIKDEYFQLAFGPAAKFVRDIFEINWFGLQPESDLVETIRNINQSIGVLDIESSEMDRLIDLMAYVLYLERVTAISSAKDVAQIRDLVSFAESIESRRMTNAEHLARHFNVVLRKLKERIDVPDMRDLTIQLSDAEILTRYEALSERLLKGLKGEEKFTEAVTRSPTKYTADSATVRENQLWLRNSASITLGDVDQDGKIEFNVFTSKLGKSDFYVPIDVFRDGGQLIYQEKIDHNVSKGKLISIAVNKGERVTLKVQPRIGRYGIGVNPEVLYVEGEGVTFDKPYTGTLYLSGGKSLRAIKFSGGSTTTLLVGEDNNGYQLGKPAGTFWLGDYFEPNQSIKIVDASGKLLFPGGARLLLHQ